MPAMDEGPGAHCGQICWRCHWGLRAGAWGQGLRAPSGGGLRGGLEQRPPRLGVPCVHTPMGIPAAPRALPLNPASSAGPAGEEIGRVHCWVFCHRSVVLSPWGWPGPSSLSGFLTFRRNHLKQVPAAPSLPAELLQASQDTTPFWPLGLTFARSLEAGEGGAREAGLGWETSPLPQTSRLPGTQPQWPRGLHSSNSQQGLLPNLTPFSEDHAGPPAAL